MRCLVVSNNKNPQKKKKLTKICMHVREKWSDLFSIWKVVMILLCQLVFNAVQNLMRKRCFPSSIKLKSKVPLHQIHDVLG